MIEKSARTGTALLALLLVTALLAGGGPRGTGDAWVHAAVLPCLAFGLWRWRWQALDAWHRSFALVLLAALALVVLQLMPMPPAMFAALPQRASVAEDLAAAGVASSWRPMTLDVPGTLRAALGLLVFASAWLAAASLPTVARATVLRVVLVVAVGIAMLGFAQAGAGAGDALRLYDYHHPIGAIGTFANRNHFALLMAMLAPLALAMSVDAHSRRQMGACLAWGATAVVLLAASALSYSRAGIALTLLGLLASLPALMSGAGGRGRLTLLLAAAAAVGAIVAGYAWDGLAQRLAQDPLDDLRWQYLAYAPQAARLYLPWGSGLGTFRWVYAAVEPVSVMTTSYAGHAHNDVMQVAVEAGIPGLALLMAFVAMVAWASARNFPMGERFRRNKNVTAGVIAVVAWLPLLHSLVDYPLRTHAVAGMLGFLLAWTATPRVYVPRTTGGPG